MKTQPGGSTRDAILVAARGAFSAHGYRGSSISQIAREAGCSKATVLYHFHSKEEIRNKILSPLWEGMSTLADELRGVEDAAEAQRRAVEGIVALGVAFRSDLAIMHGEIPELLTHATFGAARSASDVIRAAMVGRVGTLSSKVVSAAILAGVASSFYEYQDAPATELSSAVKQFVVAAVSPFAPAVQLQT